MKNKYWDGGGNLIDFPDPGIGMFLPCPGDLKCGVGSQNDILAAIDDKCCTLYLYGHRGGKGHEGGIVTYLPVVPEPEPLPILPDEDFEGKLKEKFARNCCKDCVINIVTCGGDNLFKGRQRRRQIAFNTGCTVCGTTGPVPPGDQERLPTSIVFPNPCPNDRSTWEYECVNNMGQITERFPGPRLPYLNRDEYFKQY